MFRHEGLWEWEGGCYYSDEYLAEGYTQLLLLLLGASPEERNDPSVIPFLEAGYGANSRDQLHSGSEDPCVVFSCFRVILVLCWVFIY